MIADWNYAKSRKRTSVLIVEDNVALATCLESLLEASSYEVHRTTDGVGGLESIKLMDFDVILCDLVMPGMTGDRLYWEVSHLKPHLCNRFIFMSGSSERLKWGAVATENGCPIFWKPFAVSDLLEAIAGVARTKPLAKQESRLISG